MSETDDDVPVPEQLVEERLTLLARVTALEEMANACAEWEALKARAREIKTEDEAAWTPTPENINALPEPVRRYIQALRP